METFNLREPTAGIVCHVCGTLRDFSDIGVLSMCVAHNVGTPLERMAYPFVNFCDDSESCKRIAADPNNWTLALKKDVVL